MPHVPGGWLRCSKEGRLIPGLVLMEEKKSGLGLGANWAIMESQGRLQLIPEECCLGVGCLEDCLPGVRRLLLQMAVS